MRIEKTFKACLNGSASNQQIWSFLRQTKIQSLNVHNSSGRDRQNYIASRLAQPSLTAESTERYSMWLEYLCLYYRNSANGRLPKWLEDFRKQIFQERKISLEALTLEQLITRGWSIEEVVVSSVRLSNENIQGYLSSDHSVDYWVSLRRSAQPFFLSLLFGGDIVGQWALTLLRDKEFELLLQGKLNEEMIKGNRFNGAGRYNGYVSTVSISPSFRGQVALRALLGGVADVLYTNKENGITFSGIAANAYTGDGEKLCLAFGMKYLVDDLEYGKIYFADEQSLYKSKVVRRGSFVEEFEFNK